MKKKVLIIDDDLSVCKEIKYALESDTTTVYYATSAGDGLEQLSKQRFVWLSWISSYPKQMGFPYLKSYAR